MSNDAMKPANAKLQPLDNLKYGIEDKPHLSEAIPLGLQHTSSMILGTIVVPLIVAGAVELSFADTTMLVSACLLLAGISTMVQAYRIGPIGARLPIIMGTSFLFLSPMIDAGNQFGIAAILGAALVTCPVEIILAYTMPRIRKWFPPLVIAVVVMLIGLTLMPIGIDYMSGGVGAEDYGAGVNLFVSISVLLVILIINQFTPGFFSAASILFGVIFGYIISIPLGLVDFSPVGSAGWITAPPPLHFGLAFEPSVIFTFIFLYIITSIETMGDITGTTEAVGRTPTDEELKGGILADGVMSGIAAVFNAFPNTSFSQNVGLVSFTGVASRYVGFIAGIFLLILGLTPKIAALFQVMPDPVLGGATIVMFGMIFAVGFRLAAREVELTQRNMVILALSIGLGLGVDVRPDFLAQLPQFFQMFFGSALITGGITAVVLNLALPKSGEFLPIFLSSRGRD